MKHTFKALSTLLIIPLLSSCGGGTILVSDKTTAVAAISNLKPTEIYFSCQKCEGASIYSFEVKETYSKTIKTEISVDSGGLSFVITNSNKEEVYKDSFTVKANFEIPLENYGKYRIEINHEQFRGSYRLNWA